MIDGAALELVDMDQLASASNLEAFVGANVPGALAYYDEAQDQTVRCTDGWAGLANTVNAEVGNVLQAQAAARSPADRFGNRTIVDTAGLTGSIEDFQTLMGMSSYNAVSYIRQAMLITALDDASGRLIATSGNSAAMELYQRARAESQTRSSYQVVGASATKWVPILKIAFEALYLGAFPLAMMLMFTPMGPTVAKSYFGGFVWLAAWEPLFAILQSIVIKSATGNYRDAMVTLNGSNVENALTWANQLGVHAVESDVGLVAGYLMMSVPFLCFAVFLGANKMAGLATSMLNVSQGASIESGREGSTGNVSLGNSSFNNLRANQYQQSQMTDVGRSSYYTPDGGYVTTNRDGSTTYQAGSAQSNVGMSAQIGQTVREEVSDRTSEAWRRAETASSDLTNSIMATSSQLSEFARTASASRTAGNELGFTMNDEERTQVEQNWRQVESFAERHGLSTELALAAAVAAGAGTPPGPLSASLQANGKLSAASAENFNRAYEAAKTTGLAQSVSQMVQSSDRAFSGSSSAEGESGTNSIRSNFEQVQTETQRYASSYEEAQSLERANAWLQSKDYSYNQRITDAVIAELQEQGYTDGQISSLVNPKTTAGIKRQGEIVGDILPGIIQDLGIAGTSGATAPSPATASYYNTGNLVPIPVNPNSARVEQPNVGNYETSRDNAERLRDGNFDYVNGQVTDGLGRQGRVEERLTAGADKTDETVGGALADRAVGVVGVDPIFSDHQSPNLSYGLPSAPAQPPAAPPPPPPAPGNRPASSSAPAIGRELHPYERDIMVRTIIGEAANEGVIGQAAVAHTIRNRVMDKRWGDDPAEVSLQFKQFSTWNDGAGGNSLPTKYNPGDALYDRVAGIVDDVWSGRTPDMTGGATYYYSPAGMDALVDSGAQSNRIPNWLAQENADRGAPPATIGGQIFTGRVRN